MFEVFLVKQLCNPCPLELCSERWHIVVKQVCGGYNGQGITVNKRPDHDLDRLTRCNKLPLQWWVSEFQLYSVTIFQEFTATEAHDPKNDCILTAGRSLDLLVAHDKRLQSPQSVYAGCNVAHWAVHSAASAHKSVTARETDRCSVTNDCNDCILGDLLRPQSSWKRGWHVSCVALVMGGKKGPG